MGMERRTFYGPDIDIPSLAQALADHFSRDGYQTQMMRVSATGLMVQARKEDTLRKVAGMSSALTAVLNLEGEYVSAEIGGAKWADKGVAAGVGAIIFFPALITAGVGAYQQSQLQTKAWQFIEQYVRTNSAFGGPSIPTHVADPILSNVRQGPPQQFQNYQTPVQPPWGNRGPAGPPTPVQGSAITSAPATPVCAQCNQPLPPASKFCPACGAAASKTCFGCGAELSPSARFCNHCGTPVSR